MDNHVLITDYLWFQEGPGVRNTQYTSSGVKLLNVANFVDGNIDLSTSSRFISNEEAYGKYKHFLVDEGDFIIASSGIQVAYFEKKMGFIKREQLPLCMNTSTIRFKNLKPSELDMRYFMYYLKSNAFKNQLAQHIVGSAQLNFGPSHLKKMTFPITEMNRQQRIVGRLDKIHSLIALRKEQLAKLDRLVKSRFVEMFGDPILNSKGLPIVALGKACYLKAGITTAADAIHEQSMEYPIPCYGGNGIRGYVKEATQNGMYPIIGRQGALCGNVQLATGKFHATEHAVLVTPLVETDIFWLFYLLKYMDLYRFHTGAAQPGLAVKTLNTIDIPVVDINSQHRFSAFATEVEKSKLTIQASLDKLELLKKSLMQQYFG